MAALGIFLMSFALVTIAGVAVRSVVNPRGRWLTYWSAPLGACVLILVLSSLATVTSVGSATWIASGLVIAALAAGIVRRIRSSGWNSSLAAITPNRHDLVVTAAGIAVGLVFLIPYFVAGFPTLVQTFSEDSWYSIGTTEWLRQYGTDVSLRPPDVAFPIFGWSAAIMHGASLPIGFESLVASVMELLDVGSAYVVLGSVTALTAPIAVASWALVHEAITQRRTWAGPTAGVVTALSPLLILAVNHSNLASAFGVALASFALATAVVLFRAPSLSRLFVCAISCAASIATYSSILPWLGLLILASAVAYDGPWGGGLARIAPRLTSGPRAMRTTAVLACLGVTTAILGFAGIIRALDFARLASDLGDGGPLPTYGTDQYIAMFAGAIGDITTGIGVVTTTTAGVFALTVATMAAVLVSLARPVRLGPPLLLAAAGSATGVIVFRYADNDFGYGIYKALLTGGFLAAGLLVVSLLQRPAAPRALAIGLAGLALAVGTWIPVSAGLLREVTMAEERGVRASHKGLLDQIADRDESTTILLEGADAGGMGGRVSTYEMRMTAAYGAYRTPGPHLEGLHSSMVDIDPIGVHATPEFRPDRPWNLVASSRPGPFGHGRTLFWESSLFTLSAAPAIDATDYGTSWYPAEADEAGPFQWIGGPNEILVSNRHESDRNVRLRFTATSWEVDRILELKAGDGRRRTWRMPAGEPTRIAFTFAAQGSAVTSVGIDTVPGPTSGPGTPVWPQRDVSVQIRDVDVAKVGVPSRPEIPVTTG